MDDNNKKLLQDGALELGVKLSQDALEGFGVYLEELKRWNKKINLTSIDDDRGILIKHFLDSLTVCRFIEPSSRLLDIGAGAGFPGLALKLADNSLDLLLIDSVTKKVHFMRHVIRELGLVDKGGRGGRGAEAVAARAQDPAMVERYATCFDVVVTRAFAPLDTILELSLPYLAPKGRIFAMKGPGVADELASCTIPGSLSGPEIHEIRVPGSSRTTSLLIFSHL